MTLHEQGSFAVGLIDEFRRQGFAIEDQMAILRMTLAFAKVIADQDDDPDDLTMKLADG